MIIRVWHTQSFDGSKVPRMDIENEGNVIYLEPINDKAADHIINTLKGNLVAFVEIEDFR